MIENIDFRKISPKHPSASNTCTQMQFHNILYRLNIHSKEQTKDYERKRVKVRTGKQESKEKSRGEQDAMMRKNRH
jgi:hypothetical protein